MSLSIVFPVVAIIAAFVMAVAKISYEGWSGKHWVVLLAALVICVASLLSFFEQRRSESALRQSQLDLKQLQEKQNNRLETIVRVLQRPGQPPDSGEVRGIRDLIADKAIDEEYREALQAALQKTLSHDWSSALSDNQIAQRLENRFEGLSSGLQKVDSSLAATNDMIVEKLAALESYLYGLNQQVAEAERRLSKSQADSVRAQSLYVAKLIRKAVFELEER